MKKDKKLIEKKWVDDFFAIGKNERWLSDMAKKGLIIKHFAGKRVNFERGIPQNKVYRIAIFDPDDQEEIIQLYKEHGWDFVDSDENNYIFSASEDSAHTEVSVNEKTKAYVLKRLRKYLNEALMRTFNVIFSFGVLLYSFSLRGIWLTFVKSQWDIILCILFLMLYSFYLIGKRYKAYFVYRQVLFKKRAFPNCVKYKITILSYRYEFIIFISIAALLILSASLNMGIKTYRVDQEAYSVQTLTIANLEPDKKIIVDNGYYFDEKDKEKDNRVEKTSGLFASNIIESNEYGKIINPDDKEKDEQRFLYIEYFDLRSKLWMKPLINDLKNHMFYGFDDQEQIFELKDPRVDHICYQGDYAQNYIIVKGEKVVHLYYRGENLPDKDIVLEKVIKKFMV